MKILLRSLFCPLLLSAALAHHASADLVLNGNFTGITGGYTYGQFGSNGGPATGAVLTVNNWTTSGYNFVYTPDIADRGTTANGAKSGVTPQAPGQATGTNPGNEYLWGPNNGGGLSPTGVDPFKTMPFNGNFIAADGAYETGAISQPISGLTTGTAYTLTFYWAAAQQESYTTATTEQWQVSLGSDTFTTTQYSLPSQGVSDWMKVTHTFIASAATETLSFLAIGSPTGHPPFSLLGGVGLVPEPSSMALLALVGAGLTVGWFVRRRRPGAAVDSAA